MKYKLFAILLVAMFFSSVGYAADDQPAPSLGAQAGEAARELKGTADESLSTGAMKVAQASKKVEAEAQDTMKMLSEQWNVLALQLQEKTRQIQKQLDQQWQDFQKSFNKPKP
jgi:ABC-type phosphate transport system auxiliary subunit